jgi:hypothetical protein
MPSLYTQADHFQDYFFLFFTGRGTDADAEDALVAVRARPPDDFLDFAAGRALPDLFVSTECVLLFPNTRCAEHGAYLESAHPSQTARHLGPLYRRQLQ